MLPFQRPAQLIGSLFEIKELRKIQIIPNLSLFTRH